MDGRTMLKALGFDLDNTLYDQSDHITAFIKYEAKWLSEMAAVAPEVAEQVFLKKWHELTSYHSNLFDEVLKDLNIHNHGYVKDMVHQYHKFRTELNLSPNTKQILQKLASQYQLFIITDGNFEMQKQKVNALRITEYFSLIIYTGQYGSEWKKPSTIPFCNAIKSLGRKPFECAYIGDNPLSDFKGARKTGLTTIRVLTGPFAHYTASEEQSPHYVMNTIAEIEDILLEHERRGECNEQ